MSSGAGHVGHALMASHTVLSRLYKHFDTRHHLSHIARQNWQGLIPADATPCIKPGIRDTCHRGLTAYIDAAQIGAQNQAWG